MQIEGLLRLVMALEQRALALETSLQMFSDNTKRVDKLEADVQRLQIWQWRCGAFRGDPRRARMAMYKCSHSAGS